MAGKPLNRLELRRQGEAAEPPDPMEDGTEELVEEVEEEDVLERKPKKKPKAATKAKAKAKSSRAAKPAARMRSIVWTVMNDAYKAVATFDYTQKEAAEARAADCTAKGAGLTSCSTPRRFPRTPPGLGAFIPRNETPPPKAAAKQAAAAIEDDEDLDEEEDGDVEVEVDEEPEDEED